MYTGDELLTKGFHQYYNILGSDILGTLLSGYETKRNHIPEDRNIKIYHIENFKSHRPLRGI